MDTDSIRVLYDNLTISKKIVNNMIKLNDIIETKVLFSKRAETPFIN